MTVLPTAVLAEGEDGAQSGTVVKIGSSEDLVKAIKNQANGQTWEFTQAGIY